MGFELECQRRTGVKSLMPGEQKEEKSLPCETAESATFSRSERLLLKSDFSVVFKAPTGTYSTEPIRLIYRKNNLELSRLGIIIPKKIVRLATARNRSKRLIRERFREVKANLPNVDIVLLLNKEVDGKKLVQGCDRAWRFLTFKMDD